MNKPIIIGIGHKKGVGKDTVANRLVDTHGFIRMSFADPLKEACRIIFHFTDAQLYGDLKEVVDKRWGKTPRQILQMFGSDALRNIIDRDVWIKSLRFKIESKVLAEPTKQLKIVVPDVRFPNEAEAIKAMDGGHLWKVTRELLTNEFSFHESEIALDHFKNWDEILINNDTMASLYQKADHLLAQITTQKERTHAHGRRKAEST
jgi:hypothetical protein